MKKDLLIRAISKYSIGILIVGLLIFLPAGTFVYTNGWLLMAILFIPIFFAGLILLWKNPALLESRLKSKEKQEGQGVLVKLSALMFLGGFIAAGLDFRVDGPSLPRWLSIAAAVLFLAAYLLYGEVLRENTYLSRIIEVQKGQKVIDWGLYAIVRHPMYAATVLLFLAIPLVLGSIWAFIIFLAYPFMITKRIRLEERLLERELEGYKAYQKKVKYRLIPYIW